MSDVAIIGIGIHPFGRTEGMTGLQQGVHAAREALSDAEMEWGDIQFAFGGSSAAGNADAMVNDLGLTGIPFMNVSNGCATGGSSLLSAYTTITIVQILQGPPLSSGDILDCQNTTNVCISVILHY